MLTNLSHDRTADRGSVFFCHCLFTTYAIIIIYPHYTKYCDGKVEKTASYFLFPFYTTDILFDIGMTIQTIILTIICPLIYLYFYPIFRTSVHFPEVGRLSIKPTSNLEFTFTKDSQLRTFIDIVTC